MAGRPVQVIDMGETTQTQAAFHDVINLLHFTKSFVCVAVSIK
jgi:hypothetical protein